ncbi:hypothetical protein [Larkinella soli]|uniref:hypothetical protein n=1 Tax=Larkinella soli TaxID=1770527 RepID=UPI000FFC5514|nr:hypothetical protein [Larkinella soli]
MRRIVPFFLLLLLIVTSCKKGGSDIENVDPRDQYLGVYDVDYSSRTVVGTINTNGDSGKGTITISKGNAADELQLAVVFPDYNGTELAKLNGSKFTMGRTRQQIKIYNATYDGEYNGTGSFDGKNLTITAVVKSNQNGTPIEWIQNWKGLRR